MRPVKASAAAELAKLVQRLQTVLHFDDGAATAWRTQLAGLLPWAARGFWTVEARLLYDLQKVCIDHERSVESEPNQRRSKNRPSTTYATQAVDDDSPPSSELFNNSSSRFRLDAIIPSNEKELSHRWWRRAWQTSKTVSSNQMCAS